MPSKKKKSKARKAKEEEGKESEKKKLRLLCRKILLSALARTLQADIFNVDQKAAKVLTTCKQLCGTF